MFFFYITLSGAHESFNGMSPSGRTKINGGFMGDLYGAEIISRPLGIPKKIPTPHRNDLIQHIAR